MNILLKGIGTYSEQELKRIQGCLVSHTVSKGKIILHKGSICQSLYFLESGSMIQYTYAADHAMNIIDLYAPGEWIFNQMSLIKQTPSETIIEAYTDTIVHELSIIRVHELIKLSPIFFQLGRLLDADSMKNLFFDHQFSPIEKYKHLMLHKPEYVQLFPLKLIASYLKITPETLSRVREKFSKEKIS